MTKTPRQQKAAERQAQEIRIAAAKVEAARVVASGRCPKCGTSLRRNLALAGWWQCGAYGSPDFRQTEHRDLPSCSFQCFTE